MKQSTQQEKQKYWRDKRSKQSSIKQAQKRHKKGKRVTKK